MPASLTMNRRTLLRATLASSAGLAAGPTLLSRTASAAPLTAAATQSVMQAFVDSYTTNVTANTTAETNAAVNVLTGMTRLWRTGDAWNTGTVLSPSVLRANMRHMAQISRTRTTAQVARAFIADRQHQSYAAIAGMGPLAALYREGALAVTGITEAPTGTPATKLDDAVPAGAATGSALGAGSATSELGQVVTLVNTLRGNYSSGNPSKAAYQYPRPWRMTADSEVVDTGTTDEFGYPVYDSAVTVIPQLLRQRGATPAEDGGFPSGHTNAFYLASLAYAYAVPERFQELFTSAMDLADTRVVSGMHSPVDVIGGRILATALAAAVLGDPANASLKSAALKQANAYFSAKVGEDLIGYAHGADTTTDAYADRAANRRLVEQKLTYGLPAKKSSAAMVVPKGAEVLLETRQPYLSAAQRREVLRTTALEAGHPLLDGPENWGRLNLFAAADGYGSFARDVEVTMDASLGGFSANDVWRNDIGGRGGLTKSGTGALTLSGDNSYRGGTELVAGTLTVASATALGRGDVRVNAGTLAVTRSARIEGEYRQLGGMLKSSGALRITVDGKVVLRGGAGLQVTGAAGDVVVIRGSRVQGTFGTVTVPSGLRADVDYSRTAVTVRLRRR
ncbi:phosphatase PAP2 family protein [Kineosporia sp. J2-2]|uniref:Phosphatase PAP2 family protein n=1 Tax=Kineosporia corallincola TaxID=2835133 RepID=A0ABS5TDX2_9ACTN|nr:phosphatase PAP2 family protein [Kineosporia corallincola]MBT0769043.1 phosphatase PAP2 family protein [Kineosporia corallincola]